MLQVFNGPSSQGSCLFCCSESFAARFKGSHDISSIASKYGALHLYIPSLFLHEDDVESYSQSLAQYYFTPPSPGKEVREVVKVRRTAAQHAYHHT